MKKLTPAMRYTGNFIRCTVSLLDWEMVYTCFWLTRSHTVLLDFFPQNGLAETNCTKIFFKKFLLLSGTTFQFSFAKDEVNGIHYSPLPANLVILSQKYQGQARFTLAKSMLPLPSHFLFHVPRSVFTDDSLHKFLKPKVRLTRLQFLQFKPFFMMRGHLFIFLLF